MAGSLALHGLVFMLAVTHLGAQKDRPELPPGEPTVTVLVLRPVQAQAALPQPAPPTAAAEVPVVLPAPVPVPVPDVGAVLEPAAPRQPASRAAPPAPTAEEWAFASSYTLKNSKGYRHSWGQQVRSMMGTAVEGPEQGMVRFRVEIAPDGRLVRLDTLWSTSAAAERLARQAINRLPQWPPTPTGRPLIFEKTLLFSPFATDGPPLYQDDCLPDPPAFGNPFAWDGKSARVQERAEPPEKPDPQSLADCLAQLPKDSIEAEIARDRRVMEQWGWSSSQPDR